MRSGQGWRPLGAGQRGTGQAWHVSRLTCCVYALSPRTPTAYRLEDTLGPDPTMIRANCLVQTTEWSACSKTCGMGISTRVTNDNALCRLEKQSRLCMVRPCEVDLEENIKVPRRWALSWGGGCGRGEERTQIPCPPAWLVITAPEISPPRAVSQP